SFAAAGTYSLNFTAAQRANSGLRLQGVRLLVDGVAGAAVTPSDTSYRSYSLAFTVAAGGSHTLALQGTNTFGDNTAFLDQVSLTTAAVSQPSDDGFEAPSLGTGFLYTPPGSAWSFSGNAGLSGNGSVFTSGNPPAPQGTQVAFLQTT